MSDNSVVVVRYYFTDRNMHVAVDLPSIYVSIFTMQVRRRDISAGARQASGASTQILSKSRNYDQVFTVTRDFPLAGK